MRTGEAREITIGFEQGVPVALDGRALPMHELIVELNDIVGAYGWGRLDMVENRRVGIKSRETYEAPGALALIMAHVDLESICLERDLFHEKQRLEGRYADLVYDGLWYSPLKQALDAFVDESQRYVTGEVRLRLEPGRCYVVGRRSDYSLYDYGLATYEAADTFNHDDSEGFVRLWGLGVADLGGQAGPAGSGRRPRSTGAARGEHALARPVRGRARPTSCMAFTVSLPYDQRLAADDIAGSRAHVRGLGPGRRPRPTTRPPPCSPPSTRSRPSWPTARFAFVPSRRGHPHRGRAAGHRAGRAGRGQAPHRPQPQRPGRHRPAAVHQAELLAVAGRVLVLQQVLLERAEAAGDAYLPGYTHLQRAQPVLLAHHLLAHGWALARDVDRLLDTRRAPRRVAARRRRPGRLLAAPRPRRRGRRPRVRRRRSTTRSTP